MNEVKKKILAVDDEPNNLRILNYRLTKEGYEVLTAEDGVAGWDILQASYSEIDLVLLDRMMPRMDGMELLDKMKEHPGMCRIPVIMQTAAAQKNQVVEGLNAGVYYYLTKPFNKDILVSIVDAAIRDHDDFNNLQTAVSRQKKMLGYITYSELECKTLAEAQELAIFLANFFPVPENAVYGISELLVNAVEHGNLGIGYGRKSELVMKRTWRQEVEKLQILPENESKKISVKYNRYNSEIKLHIKDEGPGFDWESYLEITPERALDNHGRGIALSKMISFDNIEYIGNGNEVICTVTTTS